MVEAIRHAYHDLEGDYAFVIGRVGEDRLYAFKKGSGLVAGLAEGVTCVSSDLPSILPLTRRILRVQDGEIVILQADGIELRRVGDGSLIKREVEEITESMEVAEKGGYPHFMLKEIHEQPSVAGELIHLLEASSHVGLMVERMEQADEPVSAAGGNPSLVVPPRVVEPLLVGILGRCGLGPWNESNTTTAEVELAEKPATSEREAVVLPVARVGLPKTKTIGSMVAPIEP